MRYLRLFVLSGAFLAFAPGSTAVAFDRDQFIEDVVYAQELFSQGSRQEAIEYWLERSPQYGGVDGHYEAALADLYARAHMDDLAEQTYLEGIALDTGYPRLYTGLAMIRLRQGDAADADRWARRAVAEYPGWWLGYYTLGEIFRRVENYQVAKIWLEKSLNVEPQAQTHWLMAIVANELADFPLVVHSMEGAISLDREYMADEHGMLAAAYALGRLGRFRDAYWALEILQTNNPEVDESSIRHVAGLIQELERATTTD